MYTGRAPYFRMVDVRDTVPAVWDASPTELIRDNLYVWTYEWRGGTVGTWALDAASAQNWRQRNAQPR